MLAACVGLVLLPEDISVLPRVGLESQEKTLAYDCVAIVATQMCGLAGIRASLN